MSQLETLMVLGLGSALTFVFFLLFGRVFWNMAMSAGARRSARNVPVQVLELQADRDRLRAEHAMMARKLELRLDDIRTRMTEQMAEVSRNRNRIQNLMQDVEKKDRELATKEREITDLAAKVDFQKSELRAAAQEAESRLKDRAESDTKLATLQATSTKLGKSLEEKNAIISNLNKELRSALKMAASGPVKGASNAEDRLRQRVAELTSLSADMSKDTMPPLLAADEVPDMPSRLHQAAQNADLVAEDLQSVAAFLASELPEQPARKSGPAANVISLAQRIRALQKGMDE